MPRFRLADQGPLPGWIRVWRAVTIPTFVVVAYLIVFVDLTPRQSLIVFAVWTVVVGVPALDWMRRIRTHGKTTAE